MYLSNNGYAAPIVLWNKHVLQQKAASVHNRDHLSHRSPSPLKPFHSTHPDFTPPPGAFTVGLHESAKHRPSPPPVRFGRVESDTIYLWLHVNREGAVDTVQPIGIPKVYGPPIEQAAKRIHYRPFTKNGAPADAWVQESLEVWSAEEAPDQLAPFPQVSDMSQVSITLRRSGCYGSCPSYSVTIHGDGRVDYTGNSFVSIPGTHQSRIHVSSVRALLDQLKAAHFFGFRDSYRALITDVPTYQVSLSVGAQSKTVTDHMGERVGMPAAMRDLEDAIDMTADSARWVTTSPQTAEALKQAGIVLTSARATEILHTAVYHGDLVTARHFLATGVAPSSVDPAGTPLFGGRAAQPLAELAVESLNENARPEMLKLVLTSKAVLADKASLQRALALAAKSGETTLADILNICGRRSFHALRRRI